MKMKGLLFSVLFMLIFSLVGCSSSDKSSSEPENTNDDNAVEEEVEDVTINVLTQSIEPTELLSKFQEENPHITVKWEQVDTANISQTLKTRLAAGGENLDIVTPQKADYLPLVEAGAFADLSGEAFLDSYDSVAVESTTVDGGVYGVPLTQQAYLVWYNKDIFAEHNLAEPTNWEEFLAVCEALKTKGVPPLVLAGKEDWIVSVFAGLAYSELLSDEPNWFTKAAKGEVKWTDEASLNAIEKIKTLVDKGYILDGTLGTGYDQAYQAFYQEKAAMVVNGAWSIDLIVNNTPAFEVGAFAPPGNAKDQSLKVAYTPGNTISISATSKNQEVAKTFLDFLSQPENASLFATTIKQFSSVKGSTADFHEATSLVTPIFDMEKSEMLHAKLSPTVNSIFGKAIQKLISGEATPEAVVEELQANQEQDVQ